jgi:hypothetical protein
MDNLVYRSEKSLDNLVNYFTGIGAHAASSPANRPAPASKDNSKKRNA